MKRIKKIIGNSRISFGIIGLAGFVFIAVLALLVLAPSSFAASTHRKQPLPETEKVDQPYKASKEIPNTWNWKKENINFDHMIRDKE